MADNAAPVADTIQSLARGLAPAGIGRDGETMPGTALAPQAWLLLVLNTDSELLRRACEQLEREAAAADAWYEATVPMGGPDLGDTIVRDRLDFCRCLLLLQRIAAQVTGDAYRQTGENAFRFPGFVWADVKVLNRVVSVGEQSARDYIEPGPPGATVGTYNASVPEADHYCPLAPTEEVDLCVRRAALSSADMWTGFEHVWRAFSALMGKARGEGSPLRRCRMPRGPKTRLDFMLGVAERDAPECGAFYIPVDGAKTCGRAGCIKAYTSLAVDALQLSLERRAEEIAHRKWLKSAVNRNFEIVWGEASAGARDPKERLSRFLQLLK